MRLERLELDAYGPLPRFHHDPDGGVEVFYGPNESGKTLLLEGILKLLAPDAAGTFAGLDRVNRSPVGAVHVASNGDGHVLGDGQALGGVSPVTPRHLRNVFVVRDSDLRMHEEHSFYDSVTEQIGDLHTSEIDAIQDAFTDRGRLTPTQLALSSAAEHDFAGDVRDEADALATEIREYVALAEDDDLEGLEARALSVRRDLADARADLAEQRAARAVDRYETLSERLRTYERATADLADADVDRETLADLRERERTIESAEAEIEDLTEKRSAARDEQSARADRLADAEAERAAVADRAAALDGLERRVGSHETRVTETSGTDRLARLAAAIAVAGVAAGGLGAALGSTVAGLAALGVGLVAAGAYYLLHRRRREIDREAAATVQAAREAGFDVESIDEVMPAIQAFRERLEGLEAKIDGIEHRREVTAERIDEFTERIQDARADRSRARRERDEILEDAGVPDGDAYEAAVERVDDRRRARDEAVRSLADSLSGPGPDADPQERIEAWRDELAALIEDVDRETVDPATYDAGRLSDLETRVGDQEAELTDLEERLADHRDRLEAFDADLRAIDARPFRDEPFELPARSLSGLRAAARELDDLVADLERDAEVARVGVEVFESIREAEERKIGALFEDGHAARVLESITDGRYVDVSYDPDDRTLKVHRASGEILPADALSHATTEQLYLGARVSLASQLLNAEPGFFIMDDPFLPADPDRLRRGFDVLEDLAAEGWQILYFSAKGEVGEELVDERGLPCRTLSLLD